MSKEKTPVTDIVEEAKDNIGAKAFFRKYANIIRWIPIALCGMLGIVLLLAPLAYILPDTYVLFGIHLIGYDVFSLMEKLDMAITAPVVLAIVIGGVSFLFAVVAIVLRRLRYSLACDIVSCIVTVLAFAIGVAQTAWLRSKYDVAGTFPILCLVFGLIFALMAIGELIIHFNFIASTQERLVWKSNFDKYKAWIYLAPTILLLLVFTAWPIINTIRMSMLKDYSGMAEVGGATFKFGFENFTNVAGYPRFARYLGTTMLLTVLTVPVSTMLALLIAVALNSIKWVRKTMQTIFFLPYVTNAIAIGMVFNAMFTMILGTGSISDPNSVGLINNVIQAFGGKAINWVNEGSNYAANITVVAIYIVWNALPFKILILLGGLQSVNKQYYDAAKIDGTSRARTFWRITVPMLSPMIAYVVITGFIGGFKEYSSIVGIFNSTMGPVDHEVDTMVGFIYSSISGGNQGRASAAALILFAIIFAVTMVNLYVSKKKVHY